MTLDYLISYLIIEFDRICWFALPQALDSRISDHGSRMGFFKAFNLNGVDFGYKIGSRGP